MYDSHAHLDDPAIAVPDMLAQLRQLPDWQGALTAGYGPERFAASRALCAAEPRIARSLGLHPWWLAEHTAVERALGWLELLAELQRGPAVAIGEIGLDKGLRDRLDLEEQIHWFERGLQLAAERELPVVLHIVGWYGRALEILRKVAPQWRGVVHRWSGPPELVGPYVALGLHLSLALEPRPNQAKRAVIARAVPLDRLLVESDWPFLQLDYPQALAATHQLLNEVAEWRGQDLALLQEAVYSNAQVVYRAAPPVASPPE